MQLNVFKLFTSKESQNKTSKPRKLRVENLEARQLLSVTPVGEYGVLSEVAPAAVEYVAQERGDDAIDLGAVNSDSGSQLAAPTLTVVGRKTDAITTGWNAIDGAVGYSFEYRTVGEEDYTVVTLGANKLLRQIHDLPEGAQYDIRVKALGGEYALDSEYAEITLSTKQTLGDLTLTQTGVTGNSLDFEWTAVENASGYKVMYKAVGEAEYTTLTLDATTVSITGLKPESQYYVKVCALGDGIDYRPSSFTELTVYETSEATPLETPTLTVVGKKTDALTTGWEAVDGAVGYSFEYRAVGEEDYTVVTLGADKLIRQIHVPEASQYDIRVKALGGEYALDSEYAELTLTTKLILATPEVALTSADQTSLAFEWNAVENAAGYKVMYQAAEDSEYTILLVDTTSVTLEGLEADAKYSVKVCALGDFDYRASEYSTLTEYRTLDQALTELPEEEIF